MIVADGGPRPLPGVAAAAVGSSTALANRISVAAGGLDASEVMELAPGVVRWVCEPLAPGGITPDDPLGESEAEISAGAAFVAACVGATGAGAAELERSVTVRGTLAAPSGAEAAADPCDWVAPVAAAAGLVTAAGLTAAGLDDGSGVTALGTSAGAGAVVGRIWAVVAEAELGALGGAAGSAAGLELMER
jgi:hypothetical protein